MPTGLVRRPDSAGAPAPEQVHLQFGADATTQVTVSWAAEAAVARPRLRVGPAAGDRACAPGAAAGTQVEAEERPYTDALTGETVFTYHARAVALQPGTRYAYQIVHDGSATAAGTFVTGPAGRSAPFRFSGRPAFANWAWRRPGIAGADRAVPRRARGHNGAVIDVDPERFEEMVAESLDGLPEEFGKLMTNVAVLVEHGQGPPGLLGLYEGVPLTSRGRSYSGVLPDRITIYRQAICAGAWSEWDVKEQVRRTVIHEVAHYFGIGDERLRELGW